MGQNSGTPRAADDSAGDVESDHARRITLLQLGTIVGVATVLFVARDVFLPLAIAVLITFALSPLVAILRRHGWPHIGAVLTVVALAFTMIGLFSFVVALQMGQLAQNLPTFQSNIVTKVERLQDEGDGSGIVARVTHLVSAINAQVGNANAGSGDAPGGSMAPAPAPAPPVEVVERRSAFALLRDLILPVISPVATAGLVIVVVIFMLLEREDLRDRFIRLVGSTDIQRMTRILEDAGGRVGQYLLIQLLVNLIYAVPIGLGLWLIGVPNPVLWGLLTLVLRFVPYIGSVLAAAFPLFLAFAVSPDWSALLWTAALFATVELITSNVIEPWLYGARTGVSPLAIIVAAIFWTWIWGPLGLVLSTPLTVCLVVLGRHIPQLEMFDILFGDQPVLAPHARLYQRLLAGDIVETTFRAEEALETEYLADYYRDVGIPALLLAQNDYARGVLTRETEDRLTRVAANMVTDLQPIVQEELDETPATGDVIDGKADNTGANGAAMDNDTLDGVGLRILTVGGRSGLDDIAAAMLAQAFETEGATVSTRSHDDLAPSRFSQVAISDLDCLVLNFLDSRPSRVSFLHVRRIKKAAPHLRVGIVLWVMPPETAGADDIAIRAAQADPAKILEAEEIGADFVTTTMEGAMAGAFSGAAVKPLPAASRKPSRSATRKAATRKANAQQGAGG